jgi:outer membrane biosynthesis protein TonB
MARSSKPARKTGKSKSIFEQNRYSAELSTSQLVTGVCILLMFGLACFLLGVLIGRVDHSNARMAANNPTVDEEPLTDEPVKTSYRPADAESNQPPPELRIPPQTAKTETKPPAPEPEKIEEAKARKPEPVSIDNPPAPEAKSEDLPATESAKQEPAPEPKTEPKSEPAPAPGKVAVATPEPKLPTPKQPANVLPKELDTHYGIQIGFFTNRASADKVKATLESKSSYTVQVITTAGKKGYNVVVGDYADRQTSDRARDDLRKNYGYKDCFTIALN